MKKSLLATGVVAAAFGPAAGQQLTELREKASTERHRDSQDVRPVRKEALNLGDERDRALLAMGIPATFSDNLAHCIAMADQTGSAQAFNPAQTKHGGQIGPILAQFTAQELTERLGRKVEKIGTTCVFHPHPSLIKTDVAA